VDALFEAGDLQLITETMKRSSALVGAAIKLHTQREINAIEQPQGTTEDEALKAIVLRRTDALNNVAKPLARDVGSVDRAWAQVIGLDRYERRALSKRRRAMRRLAELRN
jgi:hypothetical protein